LLESLQKFTGTVVFVSHDRYFIDKLPRESLKLKVATLKYFRATMKTITGAKSSSGAVPPAPESASELDPSPEPKQKRLNPIKLKQMKDRCQELEEEI